MSFYCGNFDFDRSLRALTKEEEQSMPGADANALDSGKCRRQ